MAENHKLFNNEKINVYEAQDEVAIDVFDVSSSGTKPDSAILVTTGTYVPGAISVNVTNKIPGSLGVKFVGGDSPVPPGPGPEPSLPPYTIRLKFKQGTTPRRFSKGTGVLIDEANNIWDLTYENSDWQGLLSNQNYLVAVIEANTEGIVNMSEMFKSCTKLVSVPLFNTTECINMYGMFSDCPSLINSPLFDTSKATYIGSMFSDCSSLTTVPLFNTSNVTDISFMFYNCTNVQSGALALYQQVSTQSNPPKNIFAAFKNCGINTETGAAELAQIPDDWK